MSILLVWMSRKNIFLVPEWIWGWRWIKVRMAPQATMHSFHLSMNLSIRWAIRPVNSWTFSLFSWNWHLRNKFGLNKSPKSLKKQKQNRVFWIRPQESFFHTSKKLLPFLGCLHTQSGADKPLLLTQFDWRPTTKKETEMHSHCWVLSAVNILLLLKHILHNLNLPVRSSASSFSLINSFSICFSHETWAFPSKINSWTVFWCFSRCYVATDFVTQFLDATSRRCWI